MIRVGDLLFSTDRPTLSRRGRRIGEIVQRGSAKSGFSLVELMIVVAIVGILSAIAVQGFKSYMIRAHRAEVWTSFRTFRALVASYTENSPMPSIADASTEVDGIWATLSSMHFHTSTACHRTNAFGFQVSNCLKSRYGYYYTSEAPGIFLIGAWDNGRVCNLSIARDNPIYCPIDNTIRMRKDAILNDCENVIYDAVLTGCQGPP